MIPKIKIVLMQLKMVSEVLLLLDGRKPHSILHEIFSDTGSGTLIR